MILLNQRATQMDSLLDKMAEALQLDDTRRKRMEQHYNAVKDWIEADETFFKRYIFEIYPHGSVRILTTVRPIGSDEFDLDIVLHIKSDWSIFTPQRIFAELKRRLEEHETYKKMMELKNRCIRLNYAGDFHMDILPGIQESIYDDNKIKVPDRLLGDWVSSNPRGYSKWFLDKANSVRISLLEKALRAENLPADNFNNKKPLQRAVQLIKRYRDIYFQSDDRYRTSSIILTTIAGQFYNGEESIFDTIENIIKKAEAAILSSIHHFRVFNPVNAEEEFTDKWHLEPQYYTAFKAFCAHLAKEWQKLKMQNGIVDESHVLKGLFGTDLYVRAQKEQTNDLEILRREKKLAAERNSGLLGTATKTASIIPLNTFYGD